MTQDDNHIGVSFGPSGGIGATTTATTTDGAVMRQEITLGNQSQSEGERGGLGAALAHEGRHAYDNFRYGPADSNTEREHRKPRGFSVESNYNNVAGRRSEGHVPAIG